MLGPHFIVSEGGDYQRRQVRDAAAYEPHEVEGGRVRPVDVLDHKRYRGRGTREATLDGREELVRLSSRRERFRQVRPRVHRDVDERAKGTWSRERVAAADEHVGPPCRPPCELGHEGGLACPSLCTEKHERTPTLRGGPQPLAQLLQESVPFK